MHCTSPLSFKAKPGFVVIKLQSHFLGLLVQTGMTYNQTKEFTQKTNYCFNPAEIELSVFQTLIFPKIM